MEQDDMIALASHELVVVTGGADAPGAPAGFKGNWYTNVLDKAAATAADMADKGSTYGAVIGFGAAAAGGVTLPAAGLAALAGSVKGGLIGYGVGFVAGAGSEAYRTWDQRPFWK